MLRVRVIPCLLLKGQGLVKTKKFQNPVYVGDPVNAVKIFNEKEVDELIFLDILASKEKKGPNFDLIKSIASEAFMPFAYGGGISKIEEIEKLFHLGVEKVILNTSALENLDLIKLASEKFGNQSIVISIDLKKKLFGGYSVYSHAQGVAVKGNFLDILKNMVNAGAGEVMINSVDRDGMQSGYDIELLKSLSGELEVPLIACGGAGSLEHMKEAVERGGADAVAAGSMFVFYGRHNAVLITYPKYQALTGLFE